MSGFHPQLNLFSSISAQPDVLDAVEAMVEAGIEERGAVFTRRQVVEFMLDLAGYLPEEPLYRKSLLEPSNGADLA